MENRAFRNGLGVLLISCGLIVILSYAFTTYLMFRHIHPADPSAGRPTRPAAPSSETLTVSAEKELKEGQIEQALVNFREALSLNPLSLRAQLGLAWGEYTAGREAVAAREFERALQLDHQNGPALLALARIHSHRAETLPEAASDYRNYLKQNPDDARAQLGLARVLAWQRKAAEAVILFERSDVVALMTDADLRDYAFALTKLKRDARAMAVLRTLLAKRPDDSELNLQLADVYAAHRNWSAALPIYRDLLAKRLGDPSLALRYGLALLAAGHYRAALGPLERARAAMPTSREAGLAYARAMKGTGELKRAVKEYEKVLPQFEGDTSVVREYADALLEKKDYEKSSRYYGVAYSHGLQDDRLLAGYADSLSGAGKNEEALPYLEELYRRNPTPRVTLRYGLDLLATGHYQSALGPLERARAAMPTSREAGLAFARAMKGTGELKRAVKEYEKVLPQFEADTSVIREYADVLLEKKDYEKSSRYYGVAYSHGLQDDRLLAGYADSLSGAGKNKEALPYLEELYRRNPTPRVTLRYGLALLANGHYRAALEPLERARAAMPTSREAGLAYARAMKGTGELKRAVKEYEKVLPQFEGDTSVVREYADVLLEKKDYEKSSRYYGVAYSQGLQDDRLLAGYAGSLSGAGKNKEALPYLEELYRRNPTPRVTLELAKLLHRLGRNNEAKELLSQMETSSPQLARSPGF
jgi:tetratricopeptide (TPR) repeat protein